MQVESIVEKKSMQLLHKAISFQASDLHIVPEENQYEVYFRKYNKLISIETYPIQLGTRIITYLKFLSSLDIGEKRKPQSGSFQKEFDEKLYSFRLSTLPSVYNLESIVIRILLQKSAHSLIDLAYSEEQVRRILTLIEHQQGMLLITGATGTGKTTTLYSLLHHCVNDFNRHVISLEDPVEQTQHKMLQIQVNERAGISYLSGLKAILRHTPDVIMIGEIRDRETANVALQAALSGHLVFATIHSKNSVSCLYRLHDFGISVEEMRQALIGILAQTLIEINADERKAIYEVLCNNQLNMALTCISKKKEFQLPWHETIKGQLERIELISIGKR